MCDPTAIMLGLGVASAVTQRGAGRVAQIDANAQAEEEIDSSRMQAAMIRRAGERQRGSTLAAVAASGVKIGEGSALDAERQVMEDAYSDEYMMLLSGERRARALRRYGKDARRAADIQAFTTLLSTGANAARASGWRANGPGYSGGQAPAPVETRYVAPPSRSGSGWMDY